MTKKITTLLSIIAISTLTIGCGGSYSTIKTNAKRNATGTVIDDYIYKADVCVDFDENGKLNKEIDHPCTTTNKKGLFSFKSDVSNSPLVMSGGVDIGTNKNFTGTFTAPAGSTKVTPLTTIVQAIIKISNGKKTVAQAQAIVKKSLNLLSTIDLTKYDPIAALSSTSPSAKKTAKTVFAQQSSIQTILTTVASTIAAAINTKENNVTDIAANQIAEIMLSTPTSNVADSSNVKKIIEETATDTNATVEETLVTAVAELVEATSTQIIQDINTTTGAIGDIRQVAAQVTFVTQTNVVTIARAIDNNDTEEINNAKDNLDTAIDDAVAHVADVKELTEVATEESAPPPSETTLTGAIGGN